MDYSTEEAGFRPLLGEFGTSLLHSLISYVWIEMSMYSSLCVLLLRPMFHSYQLSICLCSKITH
jgi:hypothetical protein